jgi:hypothetical protein
MKLGMPVYQGINLLDVSGPLEMFYWAGRSNEFTTWSTAKRSGWSSADAS